MFFNDRFHAAKLLSEKLQFYKNDLNTIVLAIPRGALQIGYVLAKDLNLPLDIVITKKISAPYNPEFAIAALDMDSDVIFSDEEFKKPAYKNYIDDQKKYLIKALNDKFLKYHPDGKYLDFKGKNIILIDDGVATGNTIISAIKYLRKKDPLKIIVALPVAPKDTIKKIEHLSDETICLYKPDFFQSVGQFFKEFNQVEDDEALNLFKEANK